MNKQSIDLSMMCVQCSHISNNFESKYYFLCDQYSDYIMCMLHNRVKV